MGVRRILSSGVLHTVKRRRRQAFDDPMPLCAQAGVASLREVLE